MAFEKITEQESLYHDLEHKETLQLLTDINTEDKKVAYAVEAAIPQITSLVEAVYDRMRLGGRLFYIGAGTSGRLGILDASECPPTYGVPHDWVIGLIAGGDTAVRKAVEFAEDSESQAWEDMRAYDLNEGDIVIGIAASGTTPYVISGMRRCQEQGIATGCITCNPHSPVTRVADFPVEVAVGPEYVTGSTRMKSGTAQKMVLNMISTATMIKLGRVKGNRMVDMQLSNNKLVDRGAHLVSQMGDVSYEVAKELLLEHGSVRKSLQYLNSTKSL